MKKEVESGMRVRIRQAREEGRKRNTGEARVEERKGEFPCWGMPTRPIGPV